MLLAILANVTPTSPGSSGGSSTLGIVAFVCSRCWPGSSSWRAGAADRDPPRAPRALRGGEDGTAVRRAVRVTSFRFGEPALAVGPVRHGRGHHLAVDVAVGAVEAEHQWLGLDHRLVRHRRQRERSGGRGREPRTGAGAGVARRQIVRTRGWGRRPGAGGVRCSRRGGLVATRECPHPSVVRALPASG